MAEEITPSLSPFVRRRFSNLSEGNPSLRSMPIQIEHHGVFQRCQIRERSNGEEDNSLTRNLFLLDESSDVLLSDGDETDYESAASDLEDASERASDDATCSSKPSSISYPHLVGLLFVFGVMVLLLMVFSKITWGPCQSNAFYYSFRQYYRNGAPPF